MTVLYVDDEPTIRRAVELWLARYGIHVVTAASIVEARDQLDAHHVDGVFLDVWLEDGSGIDFYDWLRTAHPALAGRVAFVTGDVMESSHTHVRLARLDCPVLRKPFDLDALKDVAARWVRSAGSDNTPGRDAGSAAQPETRW